MTSSARMAIRAEGREKNSPMPWRASRKRLADTSATASNGTVTYSVSP